MAKNKIEDKVLLDAYGVSLLRKWLEPPFVNCFQCRITQNPITANNRSTSYLAVFPDCHYQRNISLNILFAGFLWIAWIFFVNESPWGDYI